GDVPGYATRIALRELGRRVQFPDTQIGHLDELISPLAGARAPGLLALHSAGPDTAALEAVTVDPSSLASRVTELGRLDEALRTLDEHGTALLVVGEPG